MKVSKRKVLSASIPLVAVITMVTTLHGQSAQLASASKSTQPPTIVAGFADLPLSFEANQGQADPDVKFTSRGSGYMLSLNADEAVLSMRSPRHNVAVRGQNERSESVHMKLIGASRASSVKGVDALPGKSNYFVGHDRSKWHANVPTYAKVQYHGVYPGIDLIYYGNQHQLEYDFVVAPGADPRAIELGLGIGNSRQTESVHVDASGGLVIGTANGDVRFLKPVVYQTSSDSDRQFVDGRFVVNAKSHLVGFEVGGYDKQRPLIIDPVLSYSTYLGDFGDDGTTGIAVDTSGNAFVSGFTCGRDDCNATVTEINAAGTALVYSAVFGGANDFDQSTAIALDALGNAYATGITCAPDFPVTSGAFQTTLGDPAPNCDAFVTKLDPTGQLLYSTYLGGKTTEQFDDGATGSDRNNPMDIGYGIAVDGNGIAYVAGQTCSRDFPTKNALQSNSGAGIQSSPQGFFARSTCDGFAVKLDPAGGGSPDLLYSTYLGGTREPDAARAIALDSSKFVYVAGHTCAKGFPTTPGAFQRTLQSPDVDCTPGDLFGAVGDAFIVKLDMTKSGSGSLLYSTFLGGHEDEDPQSIAVDSLGNVYVSGGTSSDNFPTTDGAFQTSPALGNGFVSKLQLAGNGVDDLLYSSYFPGAGAIDELENQDVPELPFPGSVHVAVGLSGSIVVGGQTCSSDFPATSDAFQGSLAGACDAYLAKLNPVGGGSSDLIYASFLGGGGQSIGFEQSAAGVALDSAGNVYVSGVTDAFDFPHTADAAQRHLRGAQDGFVARIPTGNFSLSSIAALTADVGGSVTSSVTVNAAGDFNAPVTLSASSAPGVTAAFNPQPVTPPLGGSTSSAMTVKPGVATTPGTFSLTVTGTSGLLTHSASTQLTVRASSSGTGTIIGVITAAGCIDNSGISGALIDQLTQAQAFIDAGRIKNAVNTLSSLLSQLQAQSGKHIGTSCTIDGQTFNPVDVLIADVTAILATLQ